MRLTLAVPLVLGTFLAATGPASAQERKGEDGGPKQFVVHEGFVWKAWATKGQRAALAVAGILKKKGGSGEIAYLTPTVPQGINPKILILEVHLGQLPGAWPEPLVDLPVVYWQPGYEGDYDSVTVRLGGDETIDLRVNEGPEGSAAQKKDSE
jgi:hypothetical protein